MPWALLQRIDSPKDSLCHLREFHSIDQVLFRSLESVTAFECGVYVKKGCFFLFQTNSLSCCFLFFSEKGIGVSHLTDIQRKCQAICLFCVRTSLLKKYVITWKYSVFCGMYCLLTQPFWTWV